MTVEEAIKQAIRCAVGGCSEDCPYCDSDNVCHASEDFAENLEKALSEFRELKEKKYDCDIKHLFGECSYAETGCSDCIGKLKIKDALEKATAKSPAYQGEHEKCPTCGSFCIGEYCIKCGQRILCD